MHGCIFVHKVFFVFLAFLDAFVCYFQTNVFFERGSLTWQTSFKQNSCVVLVTYVGSYVGMNLYPGIEVFLVTGTPDKRGIIRDINIQDNLVCAELKDGSGCEWFFADEVQRIPKRKKPKGWLTYSSTFGVIPQEVADRWENSPSTSTTTSTTQDNKQRNVPPPRTPPIKPPMTPREKRAQKRNTPKAKQLPPAPTPQELRKTRASSARKRQRNGNVTTVTDVARQLDNTDMFNSPSNDSTLKDKDSTTNANTNTNTTTSTTTIAKNKNDTPDTTVVPIQISLTPKNFINKKVASVLAQLAPPKSPSTESPSAESPSAESPSAESPSDESPSTESPFVVLTPALSPPTKSSPSSPSPSSPSSLTVKTPSSLKKHSNLNKPKTLMLDLSGNIIHTPDKNTITNATLKSLKSSPETRTVADIEKLNAEKQKKAKKKADKRRRQKASRQLAAQKKARTVHFGGVHVREFERSLGGGGGIPERGGWALGLGQQVREFQAGSIEAIDLRKAKVRADKIKASRERSNSASHDLKLGKTTKALKLKALSQEERKHLFEKDVVNANVFERSKEQNGKQKRQQKNQKHKNNKNKHKHNKNSNKNNSNNNHSNNNHSKQQQSFSSFDIPSGIDQEGGMDTMSIAGTRDRSDSQDMLSKLQSENQAIVAQTITVVQSREHKHQGCQCTRAFMSKINHRQLPQMLKEHNLESNGLGRNAMSQLYLSEVVEKMGLCVDRACKCYSSGIGCHHATCSCTCTSNFVPLTPRKSRRMSMGGLDDTPVPTLVIKCGSKYNRYEYDEEGVSKYRKNVLKEIKIQCLPCQ